jgi:cytochrome b6-f complex iron-sulfur subunit
LPAAVESFYKERLVTTPQRPMPIVIALSSEQPSVTSRRQFCARACQAASLVAVGSLLPACGGGGDDGNPTSPTTPVEGQALALVNGSVSGRTVSIPVSSGALAAPGSAALVQSQLGGFLVFRNSQTSFTVLTAVCTHEGCTVDHFNGQLYVCPCHGSKYTTGGSVANGPANRSLTTFPSTLSGDTLTFTA